MLDLAIRNVQVLDGTGQNAVSADVEIEGGRVRGVGRAGPARREIDGRGAHLAPGFIDAHSHDDGAFLGQPGLEFKLAQGVTSVVGGNCGFSAMPTTPDTDLAAASGGILTGLDGPYADLSSYFAAASARKPAINNMLLIGHNTLRTQVMGAETREPTGAELAAMRGHIERAMEQGACGFSTGLIYRPGRYSRTEEVISLARAIAPQQGLYTTHMRNENDRLLEAVEEALRIGREAGVHLHISHHKSSGQRNWGKVRDSLARVDRARAEGQPVSLDVYPYSAASGRMIEYFDLRNPSRELAQLIRIASCPAFPELEGRALSDIASERAIDIADLVRQVLTAPGGERTLCISFIMDERDVETNLAYRDMMVGSDGIPDLQGRPHPRLFGTFPRVLSKYVRERGILTLPEAVRRMTSLPARTFGMLERGEVREGYWADLVMFDAATVHDTATYDDPKQAPAGIQLVVVNGQIAYEAGKHTGAGAGKMLRYRQSAFGEAAC